MSVQHGGNHYKDVPPGYQPIEIGEVLNLSPAEYSVLKYLLRYKKKAGLEDLKKMMHFGQILMRMQYGVNSTLSFDESQEKKPDSESLERTF